MTFDEIVDEVLTRCNLSSTEATTRVENSVNRHYARITSLCGMETARFVTSSVAMTVGVKTVTFPSIEKIDRIIDVSVIASPRPLEETSIHEIRTTTPGTSAPTRWATQNTNGISVVILTDTIPDAAYSLQADGWTTLSELTSTDVPAFPASFHDILTFYVLDEELLRKEKADLADRYKAKADELLARLQFHLADSPTQITRQGDTPGGVGIGGGAGGGGSDADYAVLNENETVLGFWTFGGTITLSNATPIIKTDSTDTADNKVIEIVGGGDSGLDRGGRLLVAGNEHATTPGISALQAGNVAGGKVVLSRGDGGHALEVASSTGLITLNYGQLKFPATANPSSDANTFDDYEEGTWTPAWAGSGGQSGQVYTLQEGNYTKHGRTVECYGRMVLSTLGTITTTVYISGLPFTSLNVTMPGGVTFHFWNAMTSSYVYLAGYVNQAATNAIILGATAAATGLSTLAQANLSATTEVRFTIKYEAST